MNMDAQILIKCGENWFEFSKSKTGQLDYVGKWDKKERPNVEGWQELSGSTYFSPSYYVFIQLSLNFNPKVYVAPKVDVSDKDVFSFLLHAGALISAVDAKDSTLAGELYLGRREVFEKFAQLSSYIMEPLSVEILFTLVYGRMNEIEAENIPLIFEPAKNRLNFDPSTETLRQAFMRYFKKNDVVLTLPLVGTKFYSWGDDFEPEVLERLTDNLSCEDLAGHAEKIRKAKQKFYEGLETVVQAEPYNSYDKNSILCCIENVESKICGNAGLEKAGHIRALAAAIIRESKPSKLSYGGRLVRLSYNEIVVEVKI